MPRETYARSDPALPHVMIFGTRTFSDYGLLCERMDKYTADLGPFVVITGEWRGIGYGTPGYRGADLLGEQWAYGVHKTRGFRVPVVRFPPEFELFPRNEKGAFHKRNRDMVEYLAGLRDGFAVGFHDGVSSGTASVIELLKKSGITHRVVRYGGA